MFDVSGYQPGVYFICWQGEGDIGVVKRLVVVGDFGRHQSSVSFCCPCLYV
jgi:hypothetical protein